MNSARNIHAALAAAFSLTQKILWLTGKQTAFPFTGFRFCNPNILGVPRPQAGALWDIWTFSPSKTEQGNQGISQGRTCKIPLFDGSLNSSNDTTNFG